MKLVSVIIPTFNGMELLRANLPSVIEAVEYLSRIDSGVKAEIVVVDDGSTDGSIDFIRKNYIKVNVVPLDRQGGFSHACNMGARYSKGDVFIFLNNDVRVEPDFIDALLRHFDKKDIFAVGAKSITSKEGLYNESVSQAYFERGAFTLVHPQRNKEKDILDKRRPILYPCGVAFACDRDKFFSLGGFDEIYAPFFWEDVDLGYRSWKRGWKVLYEPESLVYHMHRQTISRVTSNNYAERVFLRNSFIFIWKNITSQKMFYCHIFYIFYWICMTLIHLRLEDIVALVSALRKWPEILKKRRIEKREQTKTDEDVLTQTWQI